MEKIGIDQLRPGDIILVAGSSELSKIIEAAERNDEIQTVGSDTDIAWKESHGMVVNTINPPIAAEAVANGICPGDIMKEYYNNPKISSMICLRTAQAIDPVQLTAFINQFLNIQKGFFYNLFHGKSHYAFLNLPAFLVYFWTKKHIWLGTSADNTTSFCCEDFCGFVINHFFPGSFPEHEKTSSIELFYNRIFTEKYIIK